MRTVVLNKFIFFFNDPATTEIYTLSLHDALPISPLQTSLFVRRSKAERALKEMEEVFRINGEGVKFFEGYFGHRFPFPDRKSTRLNSSHANISYAVFCLKKKKYNLSLLHTHI